MLFSGKKISFRSTVLPLLFLCVSEANAQYSDTIYYTDSWMITEKPFSSFFRIGYVGYGNPSIIYTGKVTDHYADGTIEMEGNYSADGLKTGPFRFYFRNGKLFAEGNYKNGRFDSTWNYYFSNGQKMSHIDFDQANETFTVQESYDSTGRILAKDGTGGFSHIFYDLFTRSDYRISGSMNKGRRSGTWEYYQLQPGKKEIRLFSEKYTDGVVKKTSYYSLTGMLIRTYPQALKLLTIGDFEKFSVIENFAADPTVFKFAEGKNERQALKDFLFDKAPILIDAKGDSIHQSFNIILSKLNTYWVLPNFNDPYKDYRAIFSFHISDSGTLRDLEIESNFSDREEEMARSIFGKFRNVKPIMIENVEVDALHRIYYYSIHIAEILPKRLQDGTDSRILAFTMIPREKLVAKLKKDVKLKLKTNDEFIYFINRNLRWQLRD